MMRHIVILLICESSLGFEVMLRRTSFNQVEWHCNHTLLTFIYPYSLPLAEN